MKLFSNAGGFTLVEVMVALVIIGIAMVTLIATQVGSTRSYAEAKVMTVASMLAAQKLTDLEAGEYPEPGEESGVFEDNENYRWTLSVKETDLDELREVILDVSLAPPAGSEEEEGLHGVTVVTFVADRGEEEEEEEAEGGEGEEASK